MAQEALEAAPATEAPTRGNGKRAVVVIHGIGNQSPMETLRGLVDTVWSKDPRLVRHGTPRTWSKRDTMSNSHELHRITTSEDRNRTRTDFFEFYWAHLTEDTRIADVVWWLWRVLKRSPDRVPPNMHRPWIAGVAGVAALGVIAAAMLLLLLAATRAQSFSGAAGWLALAVGIWLLLWFLRHRVLLQVVGDAGRYLTASPENIEARARIRTAGLELLKQLHASNDYERIIFVCHSLGTVVGYDLLSFYWGSLAETVLHEKGEVGGLMAIEVAADRLVSASDADRAKALADYRTAQRAYARKVGELTGGKWLVTDFVTLGSPLTHASFLMVDDRETRFTSDDEAVKQGWLGKWFDRLDEKSRKVAALFLARAAQRDFAVAPPLSENGIRFSYERKLPTKPRSPHHAAVFAPVRWTNLFAPRKRLLWGDVVGGPVAPLFGPGVMDVALSGEMSGRLVAHTLYWDEMHSDPAKNGGRRPDREHLEALRAAINLLDEPEDKAWERHRDELAWMRQPVPAAPTSPTPPATS